MRINLYCGHWLTWSIHVILYSNDLPSLVICCNTSVCSFWMKWSSLATWHAVRGLSPVIITTWKQSIIFKTILFGNVWMVVLSDNLHDEMLPGSLWWQPCCHLWGGTTQPWTQQTASHTPEHCDSSPGPMWTTNIQLSLFTLHISDTMISLRNIK